MRITIILGAILMLIAAAVCSCKSANYVFDTKMPERERWYLVDTIHIASPYIVIDNAGAYYVIDSCDLDTIDIAKSINDENCYLYSDNIYRDMGRRVLELYDKKDEILFLDYEGEGFDSIVKTYKNCYRLLKFQKKPSYFMMALTSIDHFNDLHNGIDGGEAIYVNQRNLYIRVVYPVYNKSNSKGTK